MAFDRIVVNSFTKQTNPDRWDISVQILDDGGESVTRNVGLKEDALTAITDIPNPAARQTALRNFIRAAAISDYNRWQARLAAQPVKQELTPTEITDEVGGDIT